MEKEICRIYFENEDYQPGKGTGFFCEIDEKKIPMKYGLFTNYHVLNPNNIEKSIKIDIIDNSDYNKYNYN